MQVYVVPNYFIDNNYKNLREIENLLCLKYISKKSSSSIYARTTMHSMLILLEGSKVVHLLREDVHVKKNELCFLSQNNYYMSERIAKESSYKSMLLYFDDAFIMGFISKYTIDLDKNSSKDIVVCDYTKDIFLQESLSAFELYIDKIEETRLLKLKVEEIFLHVLRVNEKEFTSFLNSIVDSSQNRIKHIVDSNIDIIQSVSEMAKLARVSENRLRAYFKGAYKTTPKAYLDAKRLEKACVMLANKEYSIHEIASSCGYATSSWFIAQFKKAHNQTPKEYRHNL